MDDQSQPGQAFMSALVTEHFVLSQRGAPRSAGLPVLAAVIIGVGAAVPTFGLHMLWMYRRGRPAMA